MTGLMPVKQSLVSNSCSPLIPDVELYLPSLSVAYIVAFSLLGAAALVTLVLYIEIVVYFSRHMKTWKPKYQATFILAIYPVISIASYISLLIPRSSGLNDLVWSMYMSICINVFVAMMIGHYGGRKQMLRRLAGSRIVFSTPPLCCCLCCLPTAAVTRFRVSVLRALVLQYAVVRPFIGYVIAILWSEISYGTAVPMRAPGNYLGLAYFISTILATWGLTMIYRLSMEPLKYANVRPKFICFQLVIVLSGLQRPVINILVMTGAIGCDYPLSAEAAADRWYHMLLISEMFILMSIARLVYRRDVNQREDTEPRKLTKNEVPMAESTLGVSCAIEEEKVIIDHVAAYCSSIYGTTGPACSSGEKVANKAETETQESSQPRTSWVTFDEDNGKDTTSEEWRRNSESLTDIFFEPNEATDADSVPEVPIGTENVHVTDIVRPSVTHPGEAAFGLVGRY